MNVAAIASAAVVLQVVNLVGIVMVWRMVRKATRPTLQRFTWSFRYHGAEPFLTGQVEAESEAHAVRWLAGAYPEHFYNQEIAFTVDPVRLH